MAVPSGKGKVLQQRAGKVLPSLSPASHPPLPLYHKGLHWTINLWFPNSSNAAKNEVLEYLLGFVLLGFFWWVFVWFFFNVIITCKFELRFTWFTRKMMYIHRHAFFSHRSYLKTPVKEKYLCCTKPK